MAQMTFSLLVLSLSILGLLGTIESRSRTRVYLEAQCRATLYSDLCVETLLRFTNKHELPSPQKIAQISLNTCLAKARSTKAYVDMIFKQLGTTKTPGEYQALKECSRQINNEVDRVTGPIKKLQQMGKDGEEKFVWREVSVQSSDSADITEAARCTDGILWNKIGRKTKSMIKAKVLNVKQLSSNSLALRTRFTPMHSASRAPSKNPTMTID